MGGMSDLNVFSSMMRDCLAKQYGVDVNVVDTLFSSSYEKDGRVFVKGTVMNPRTQELFVIKGSSRKSETDAVTKALMSLYWNDEQDDIQLPERSVLSFEKVL